MNLSINHRKSRSHNMNWNIHSMNFSIKRMNTTIDHTKIWLFATWIWVLITWIWVFIAEVEYSQHKCWYSSHELEYSLQKLSIHNMNSINVIFFKLKKQIFNWWKVNNFLIFVHRYFSLQATHPLGFDSKCRFDIEENICREEGPLPDCFNKPREMVLYTIEKVHYIYLWKRTPPKGYTVKHVWRGHLLGQG